MITIRFESLSMSRELYEILNEALSDALSTYSFAHPNEAKYTTTSIFTPNK